jgi:hypothetical protein
MVLGAILVFGFIAVIVLVGGRIADEVGINEDGSVGKACTLIDEGALKSVLGNDAEAIKLEGIFDATLGLILDKRVLPDAEDCWLTADETTPTGRIAKYTGADAAAVFAEERQKAAPISDPQGGGISFENEGYFGGDVPGLGDQAFCTGVSPAIQAGVLVRQGDTLVYVSLSGPADGSPPDFATTPDGVVIAPGICATAQEVARRMLP